MTGSDSAISVVTLKKVKDNRGNPENTEDYEGKIFIIHPEFDETSITLDNWD